MPMYRRSPGSVSVTFWTASLTAGSDMDRTIVVGSRTRANEEGTRKGGAPRVLTPAAVVPKPAGLLAALLAVDGPLELGLVHLRAAGDVHPPGLVVELLLRATLRPARAGANAAAAARGHVPRGRARARPRRARARPLLVHGPRR